MHVLPAGGDLAPRALWRGQARIATPPRYLQADRAMHEPARDKRKPLEGGWQRFQADAPLLTCLPSLESCPGASHEVVAPHTFANFTWDDSVLEMTDEKCVVSPLAQN